MAGFFTRNFPPAAFAWILVAVLAVVLALVFFGDLPPRGAGPDYTAASQALANVDRSQPLRFKLEGQYAGPLQDTAIQRWRDPVDGTVCYIYLPVAVPHEPGPNNLVQYGAAAIGSISCMPARNGR